MGREKWSSRFLFKTKRRRERRRCGRESHETKEIRCLTNQRSAAYQDRGEKGQGGGRLNRVIEKLGSVGEEVDIKRRWRGRRWISFDVAWC